MAIGGIAANGSGGIGTTDLANNAVTAAKIEAQQAWQTLAFSSSFNGNFAYMKDSLGFVHIRPDLYPQPLAGTTGVTIATLPLNYRPDTVVYFYLARSGEAQTQYDGQINLDGTWVQNLSSIASVNFRFFSPLIYKAA